MSYHQEFHSDSTSYSGGSTWQGQDPWDIPSAPRRAPRPERGRPGKGRGWMIFALLLLAILAATVVLHLVSQPRQAEFPFALPETGSAVQATQPPTSVERTQPLGDFTLTLQPQPTGEPLSFQEIYAGVIPSIVSIRGTQEEGTSLGTGVVVSAGGYIITNSHVIEGCASVDITLWDESQYPAKLVGRDAESDLAVLKIEAQGLTPGPAGGRQLHGAHPDHRRP